MGRLSVQEFQQQLRDFDGVALTTPTRRRPFTVDVRSAYIEYTPHSTGEARRERLYDAGAVLDRFNDLGSFNPSEYKDLSHNASYTLALIRAILEKAGNRA